MLAAPVLVLDLDPFLLPENQVVVAFVVFALQKRNLAAEVVQSHLVAHPREAYQDVLLAVPLRNQKENLVGQLGEHNNLYFKNTCSLSARLQSGVQAVAVAAVVAVDLAVDTEMSNPREVIVWDLIVDKQRNN